MAEVVTMPKLGFDMAEGTLVRWVIAEGEAVTKGAVLAEIETDKATVEVESNYDGIVVRHLVPEGEIIPVNDPIAVIGAEGEKVDVESLVGTAEAKEEAEAAPQEAARAAASQAEAPAPAAPVEEEEEQEYPGGVKASPLARRMAEENGINLKALRGSGPGGRIVRKDVEAYLQAPPARQPEPAAPQAVAAPQFTQVGPPPPDERIPLNRLRAAIGRRMTESKQNLPHFYVTGEYDVAKLMDLRKQVNALLPDHEKTSVNDYILKAVALCLREYPNLNASLEGNEIVHHGQVNVGVAVAVEGGLLTIVNRDTDRKSVRQISLEVKELVTRARSGKVRPDDIEGSTFSVSNLGMYGVEEFIAIINPPEAAILAVGAAKQKPVVKEGQIVPGWLMKATISVDHRVSDGAEAAQFMQSLAAYLEEPLRLMV